MLMNATKEKMQKSGHEPLRVAMIMGKMLGGGVEAVVMNYYRHIDRSRVQFDFIVDEDSTLVPRDEIESLGGRIFVVPPYQNLPAYWKALYNLFRREQWLIIHSHINALSVIPLQVAKIADIPVRIAHSHSGAGKGECAKNALKAVLKRFSNVYPTHRFACSNYAGQWLFGKDADFDVVHNAIELETFAFNPEVRTEVRTELGLTSNQLAIGHVGRFATVKNHVFLIDAFSKALERRPDAVLLLAGDGTLRPRIEHQVIEYGIAEHVRFLGQRDDIERLYQAFDVLALPSLYEGLGLVGIEAQRAGLPCILSDTITHEIDVTATCRFLPIDHPQLWADAFCNVLPKREVERAEMNHSSFAKYDIERSGAWLTNKYEQLYQNISGMKKEESECKTSSQGFAEEGEATCPKTSH